MQVQGTAFITGAGSGIGAHMALKFAEHGINGLSLLDTDAEKLEKLQAEIKSTIPQVNVLTHSASVTDEDALKKAVKKTVDHFGRIDIAVNSAGVNDPGVETHKLSQEAWKRVIDINQTGCWLSQRAEIQQMIQQESRGQRLGRGVIVNVSSALGLRGPVTDAPFGPYTAAKHAMMGFTKVDAKRYGSQGIRINAICPGWVDTPLLDGVSGALKEELEAAVVGRAGQVEEIGDAILFLSSPLSSFIYGIGLVVDGGYSL